MAEAQAGDGVEASGEVSEAASAAPHETDLVRDTLGYLARSLVANVDDVRIEKMETERGVVYRLHVNPEDMGRVIGRSGRIARAVRQVTRAAAARAGIHAIIEIAD